MRAKKQFLILIPFALAVTFAFQNFDMIGQQIIASGLTYLNINYHQDPLIKTGLGGMDALSPDGRLGFRTQPDATSGYVDFQVNVLMPGNLTLRSGTASGPIVSRGADLEGKTLTMSGFVNNTAWYNIKLGTGLLKFPTSSQITTGFHPDHPRRFRCSPAFVESASGYYDCYHLVMYISNPNDQKALYRTELKVIVMAYATTDGSSITSHQATGWFNTPNPVQTLLSAQAERAPAAQRANGVQIAGFEFSTTADSRLVIGSLPLTDPRNENDYGRSPAAYNFTANLDDNGWRLSELTSLYQVQDSFNGVPFSEMYPIARQPLRNEVGEPCDGRRRCWVSYPWISQDGADLFFSTLKISSLTEGPVHRAGYSAVGARTGYKLVYLDNVFNRCRDVAEASSQSPGLDASMWAQWTDVGTSVPFPYRLNHDVYPMMTTYGELGEVDMNRLFDSHYIVNYPMNELIISQIEADSTGSYAGSGLHPTEKTLDVHRTPDVSGNFHTASLSAGASFSRELSGSACDDTSAVGDNNGFRGKGIVFPTGDSLVTASNVSVPSNSYTVELAFKLGDVDLNGNTTITLARIPSALMLRFISSAESQQISVMTNMVSEAAPAGVLNYMSADLTTRLASGVWHHLVLRAAYSTIGAQTHHSLFLDGVQIKGRSTDPDWTRPGAIAHATANLLLGPGALPTHPSAATVVVTLDEFAISDFARSSEYIQFASGQNDLTTQFFTPTVNEIPSSIAPPSWVKLADLRIPTLFKTYFSSDSTQKGKFDSLAAVGKEIFEDPKLSQNGRISCASCHQSGSDFTDNRTLAVGMAVGTFNTPTILNRAVSTKQFFDERAGSVVVQALKPITNVNEMGSDLKEVLPYVQSVYGARLKAITGSSIVGNTQLAQALSAYVLTLFSPVTKFDSIVQGHLTGSGDEQQILSGYDVFRGKGQCMNCHFGANFSDERVHQVGLNGSLLLPLKTPTLRGLASTGPYMHDGHLSSIAAVVANYKAGAVVGSKTAFNAANPDLKQLDLTAEESADLVRFLESLSQAP